MKYLHQRGYHHYAIFFELIAYPGIQCNRLLDAKVKEFNVENGTILNVKLLPSTAARLQEYIDSKRLARGSSLFRFTKQAYSQVWREAKVRLDIPLTARITDTRTLFARYLETTRRLSERG